MLGMRPQCAAQCGLETLLRFLWCEVFVAAMVLHEREDSMAKAARGALASRSAIELEKLFNDALEPHVKELGLLIHAWNELHTAIASLFLAICQRDADDDDERDMLLTIWNAVPNDRIQRHMVRMAAKSRFGRMDKKMDEIGIQLDVISDHEASQREEILWILESADKMGRKRDDSSHVPVSFYVEETLSVRPDVHYGHPIAEQYSAKDLVAEFSLTRARINVICRHAYGTWAYLIGADSQRTLPQRPAWPDPPSSASKSLKGPRPAKQPKRRPRSSKA